MKQDSAGLYRRSPWEATGIACVAHHPAGWMAQDARLLPLDCDAAEGSRTGADGLKRVLLASARNWTGVARLPSTLGPAGLEVHLLDSGDTQASSSCWNASCEVFRGRPRALAQRLLEVAPSYDRVIACDEPLLSALVAAADSRADVFLPAPRETLGALLDKTRFPTVAAAAGIRVPRSFVANTPEEAEAAFAEIGAGVFLKGAHGVAGKVVRSADDAGSAGAAAAELGWPVLIEQKVEGDSRLMPCLFERGVLVAAMSVSRLCTVGPNGPSTINAILPVSGELASLAEKAARAFCLHGFVSIDYFEPSDGTGPTVLEINPRPVPQLHLGRRVGVDMAASLHDVMSGVFDGRSRLSGTSARVVLFPQELHRLRSKHGKVRGTLRWMRARDALSDVPWDDASLVWRHLRRAD